MYVIASYSYSAHLELAIAFIEKMGVPRNNILAIPLNKREGKRMLFDSIYQSDGVSLIDLAFILGTFFMLLGGIYGYLLKWGPILWGIIGFFIGAAIGLIIDFIPKGKRRQLERSKNNLVDLFLLIHCEKSQVDSIKKILWDNHASGVAEYEPVDADE